MTETSLNERTLRPFCFACGAPTSFAKTPTLERAATGRIIATGRCAQCGGEVATIIAGDAEPATCKVKLSATAKREVERAAYLLDCSQRELLDRFIANALPDFVRRELDRLTDEGHITPGEKLRRLRHLEAPIAAWSPRLVNLPVVRQPGLLERLRDWLLR